MINAHVKWLRNGLLAGAIPLASLAMLQACGSASSISANLQSNVAGQLFCQFATAGGAIVAPIIDAAAASKGAALGAAAVVVTNMAASDVQNICNAAAQSVGASAAIPVSPPVNAANLAPVATNIPPTMPATQVK